MCEVDTLNTLRVTNFISQTFLPAIEKGFSFTISRVFNPESIETTSSFDISITDSVGDIINKQKVSFYFNQLP